jgi:hypothetical protein
MKQDPFEIAIDQILEASEGDVRLALRTVLMQNIELEVKLQKLIDSTMFRDLGPTNQSFN